MIIFNVTDEEYNIQFAEAPEIADYLQPIFELSYLLATRVPEGLKLWTFNCQIVLMKGSELTDEKAVRIILFHGQLVCMRLMSRLYLATK